MPEWLKQFWEWLKQSLANSHDLRAEVLALRLGLALLLGLVIAAVHARTQDRNIPPAPNFASTLVLLCILIAIVTQVIGDNTARAFSLVGALAIIRFRTVVEDTRDTAFVIFAVVIGMSVGAGYPAVALIGLGVVSAAAVTVCPRRPAGPVPAADWGLNVRVGLGSDPDSLLKEVFAKHLEHTEILSTSTSRQGAALDLSYRVRLRPSSTATSLVAELNRLEGVQNVELRRA